MTEPLVSVIMPVYNREDYLAEAIVSILNQTMTDFEFLIIDDASIDASREIAASFDDSRVRLLQNDTNLGITHSLNKGLQHARGKYIARMDSDDISMPERLAKQVDFLEQTQEIGLCGSWLQTIGASQQIWKYPTENEVLKSLLLFQTCLAHPTVMFRRKLFERYQLQYDPFYLHAEDYEMWTRCCRYFPIANIGETLLYYRLHPVRIGQQYAQEQQKTANLIQKNQLAELGIYKEEEIQFHFRLAWKPKLEATEEFVCQAEQWLQKLRSVNDQKKRHSPEAFLQVLQERWLLVCTGASPLGSWIWEKYASSPIMSD